MAGHPGLELGHHPQEDEHLSKTWTEDDYDSLSWHDVHVHAFRIVEGEYGSGQLWFDLDYILDWLCSEDGSCRFRVAPAF